MPSDSMRGDAELAPRWLRLITAWTWRLLVMVAALVALLWLMSQLLVVTLPLTVAVVLATLCMPLRHRLVDAGVRPGLAAVIVVIGGLVLLVGLLALLAPSLVDQLQALGPTLSEGWESLLTWLEEGPLGYDRAQLEALVDRVQASLTSGNGSGVVSGVVSGAATVGQFLAGAALLIVLLFFIVKDGPEIVDWFARSIPERHRNTASALGNRAWSALSGYVRGTALIALIDAVGIGLGLLVIGVPLVIPLTLLVFLGGFLPVIGAFIAGLIAVLVALADGGLITGLLVLAVVLGVQQVEGNLLQPTIMRRAVALHPIVVLSALGAGAAMAGIVGAFLSVPVAAVLAAVGNELRLRSEAGMLGANQATIAPATPIGGPHAEPSEA